MRAGDDRTLVFTRDPARRAAAGSYLARLALPGLYPVRQAVVEQLQGGKTDAGTLVGNGPFILQEHVPNDHLTLLPNPRYTAGPPPRLQRLTLRVVGDPAQALDLVRSGALDAAALTPQQLAGLVSDPAYRDRIKREAWFATVYVSFNTRRQPFDDARVRLALARAIDRDAFVARITRGSGRPGATLLPPSMPGYDPANEAIAGFDPEAARALLTAAGYPDGRGFPAGVTLLVVGDARAGSPGADFIAQGWRDVLNVPVAVELAPTPSDAFGRMRGGAWQAATASWSADYFHPEDFLQTLFATGGAANMYQYNNPAFDAAVEQAGAETDPRLAAPLWSAAERLLLADCPCAPILHTELTTLWQPRVGGLQASALDLALYGDASLVRVDTTAKPFPSLLCRKPVPQPARRAGQRAGAGAASRRVPTITLRSAAGAARSRQAGERATDHCIAVRARRPRRSVTAAVTRQNVRPCR